MNWSGNSGADAKQLQQLPVKFIQPPQDQPSEEPDIQFHFEDVMLSAFDEIKVKNWLKQCIKNEGRIPGEIHFVFCRDEFLLGINIKYLDHHDYTDVITFDYTEDDGPISGDIFISYERVLDNARTLGENPDQELRRVLIHGVLHLLGYADDCPDDQAEMSRKENYCLSLHQ